MEKLTLEQKYFKALEALHIVFGSWPSTIDLTDTKRFNFTDTELILVARAKKLFDVACELRVLSGKDDQDQSR